MGWPSKTKGVLQKVSVDSMQNEMQWGGSSRQSNAYPVIVGPQLKLKVPSRSLGLCLI